MNLPLVTSCVLKNNLVDNLEVVEGEFEEKIKDMDVTLACDDDYIRVHKIIQISCSEPFHIVSLNNRTLRLEKHIEMSKNFKA